MDIKLPMKSTQMYKYSYKNTKSIDLLRLRKTSNMLQKSDLYLGFEI